MAEPARIPIPAGSRVLHIGPPKTGTTSLQAAFDGARPELLRQGVRYAGPRRHSRQAVLAATGARAGTPEEQRAGERDWAEIVREIRGAQEPRVLFSSERLAHADADHIRAIVDELGGPLVHVVVTLRSLARILPAQWQQAVQSGHQAPLETWLRRTLDAPLDDDRSFWHRHAHDRLVARWRDVVGPERVTVVVLDEADRDGLFRTFEGLFALRPGTLQLNRALSNRSLTFPEAEAVRALNARVADRLSRDEHRRLIELGASFRMRSQEPSPGEPPVRLPGWATKRIAPISEAIVDGLRTSGVDVLGDLEMLRVVVDSTAPGPAGPAGPDDGGQAGACIPPRVAGALAMGLLAASGAAPGGWSGGTPVPNAPDHALAQASTRRLLGVLARRVARGGRARVRAARQRIA